jgi:hypothetical protein
MTDAIYVRRLPHLERPTPELLRPAAEPEATPAPIVCRTTAVRVNLARLLADLEQESRRLLGGALSE